MKILHVLSSNRFSGAENVACQIINLFKNDINFEMAYCSPQGPIEDVLNKKDIKYFSISSLSVSNIKQILSKYKPDVIHSHDMKASLICSLASKKIPIISHIHNNAYDSRKIHYSHIYYRTYTRYALEGVSLAFSHKKRNPLSRVSFFMRGGDSEWLFHLSDLYTTG